ncbi:MAG TPA: hypothetical protein VMW16_08675 [Sedimentisphaerales bacterium]|nr:hypothetical protein [Sedimentisphaerales bacterium]
MALFSDTQGTQTNDSWLAGLGNLVKQGVGLFAEVRDILNPPNQNGRTIQFQAPAPAPASYTPNVSLSDYAFTPNWYLLAFGAGVLILAFVISRN